MSRQGPRPVPARPRRPSRRVVAFTVEALETRSLLSATASPLAQVIAPDLETTAPAQQVSGVTNPTPAASAVTPAQLAKAYGLSTSATAGAGTTIAIVDAYNDPNIAADLAAFDAKYGLAAASLTVVNQSGQTTNLPQTSADWSVEIAMDVEWAHAAAPGATIVLVEANSSSVTDLMAAVQTGAKLANVVSMSWGGSEFAGQTAYDTAAYFANPKVTFVAASGDDGGATGVSWPASSPYVLSVGGTTLTTTPAGTASETAWSASGSPWSGFSGSSGGVSRVEPLPSYQSAALGSTYARGRVTPDVSLDANPSTGLSVYSTVAGLGQTGWFQVGGTSAGAPVWAAIVADADSARAAAKLAPLSTTQTLNLVYSLSGTAAFHDVTSGSNFAGRATTGYDRVTGLGTPVASALIAAASQTGTATTATPTAPSLTVTVTPSIPSHTTPKAPGAAVPNAQVAVTATAATVVSTADSLVVVTAPLTEPAPARPTTASTTTVAGASTPLSGNAPARPVQSLSGAPTRLATPAADVDPTELPEPEATDLPGLFLDPIAPPGIDPEAPVLVGLPAEAGAAWDVALDSLAGAEGLGFGDGVESTLPALPIDEPEQLAGAVMLAGLAFATWQYGKSRVGRSESDRRRWLLALAAVPSEN